MSEARGASKGGWHHGQLAAVCVVLVGGSLQHSSFALALTP
jgi:hypothetical protein